MVVGAHSPFFGFEKHEDECEDLVRIVKRVVQMYCSLVWVRLSRRRG